jgi:hypothetical protein
MLKKLITGTLVVTLGLILGNMGFQKITRLLNPHPSMIQTLDKLPKFEVRQDDFKPNLFQTFVRIHEAPSKNNPDGFVCTGTVISNDYVVTAAHCLTDADGNLRESINIVGIKNTSEFPLTVKAKPAAMNARSDVGLITGNFELFQKTKINASITYTVENIGPKVIDVMGLQFEIPAQIVSCGFAWGEQRFACFQIEGIQQFGTQLLGRSFMYPGMSGGAVVDNIGATLIGVNTGVIDSYSVYSPLVGMFNYFGIEVVEQK